MTCKHKRKLRDAQTNERFCRDCGKTIKITNRNYKNGAIFENQVKRYFEKMGCIAFRSAGSHGLADVIAISKDGTMFLIQCKKSGIFPKSEIAELIQASHLFPCTFLLADHKERGRIHFTNLVGNTIIP